MEILDTGSAAFQILGQFSASSGLAKCSCPLHLVLPIKPFKGAIPDLNLVLGVVRCRSFIYIQRKA